LGESHGQKSWRHDEVKAVAREARRLLSSRFFDGQRWLKLLCDYRLVVFTLCYIGDTMTQQTKIIEGTISPKHQITIPAQIRDALGLRPGQKIEFKLEQDNVIELRVKRPNVKEVLDTILEKYDFSGLREETKGDAVKTLRENRWGDDL
jgi:antitoxin PrlF